MRNYDSEYDRVDNEKHRSRVASAEINHHFQLFNCVDIFDELGTITAQRTGNKTVRFDAFMN